MAAIKDDTGLDTVLILGGCGFVGFHLVGRFLEEPTCTSVAVISRTPNKNRLPGVAYHAGDICDTRAIRTLISEIRPSLIVHAACPPATTGSASDFDRVTIHGTKNLLEIALEAPSVKGFIFTSTATMAAGSEHVNLDERALLADADPRSHPYVKTKARADKMVLAANRPLEKDGKGVRTASIRLPIIYGERDPLAVLGALAALERGETNVQIGDGSNLWDFVSVGNAANAHVLLAKSLLRFSGDEVDGEAFNITDGEPRFFWDFARTIWKAAGHKGENEKIWVLPTRVALPLAILTEWIFWLFAFGTKRPKQFNRQQVEFFCFTHTYRIDKSKERLGYAPNSDFEAGIRKSVEWAFANEGWASRLQKKDHRLKNSA